MNKLSVAVIAIAVFTLTAFKPSASKLISKDAHISFFSHTAVEDITANNYKVVSTLNPTTGDIVYSVPMQSFEFDKALMQKHYNSSKFLDTKKYPKAKFTGKISDLASVDFTKDGSYEADITGNLTIKDKTNPINEKATITVKDGKVSLNTKMNLALGDYGITFSGGKPSTNIAKEIAVTVKAIYQQE
ncbi:YceI family protein [Maribacter polysiphoniae]|uniref:YceI family protein n=1 Tax=Maribacter polysiphoniae TaxID=429344 RepID=A0A316DT50_9FLAO|nr:YceI family protein [Maribacter polysiphoniae]MBD1262633.1 YceI family protein [Maribacter polysiphoniae]PWK21165.1 YceI-like domain-containing protein [Maribacter polysiphoniae]